MNLKETVNLYNKHTSEVEKLISPLVDSIFNANYLFEYTNEFIFVAIMHGREYDDWGIFIPYQYVEDTNKLEDYLKRLKIYLDENDEEIKTVNDYEIASKEFYKKELDFLK